MRDLKILKTSSICRLLIFRPWHRKEKIMHTFIFTKFSWKSEAEFTFSSNFQRKFEPTYNVKIYNVEGNYYLHNKRENYASN
ncbi:MAG: hypothetical protein ACFFEY_17685 [Candidatus Thorarchaeota archaeon]